jgi:hypothetical protein
VKVQGSISSNMTNMTYIFFFAGKLAELPQALYFAEKRERRYGVINYDRLTPRKL